MEMFSLIEMEEFLRDIAKQKIKSFYIEYFAEQLELDLAIAAKLLNDFANQSDKLTAKYEIRCEECTEFITEFDNIEDIELGMEIDCINCPNETIIISEDNIYIKYYISEEFMKCVNSHRKMKGFGRKGVKARSTPSSSISDLENKNVLKTTHLDDRHITVNYIGKAYINNGSSGNMGDYGTSRGNMF